MKLNIEVKTEDQRNELIKQLQEMEFKKELPKSWEHIQCISGFYIDEYSVIKKTGKCNTSSVNQNLFATEKQAKSALAKAKLSQLMKVYNDGWVADWKNVSQIKFCINFYSDGLYKSDNTNLYNFLSFKDAKTRYLFLRRFEKDIRIYFEQDILMD